MVFPKSSNNMLKQLTIFSLLYTTRNKLLISQTRNSRRYFQLVDNLVGNSRAACASGKFHRTYRDDFHTLKDVYADSGAVANIPKWYRFGILKVIATIFCFVILGSMISKVGVKFLEENDIFKPDDDDDNDDDED